MIALFILEISFLLKDNQKSLTAKIVLMYQNILNLIFIHFNFIIPILLGSMCHSLVQQHISMNNLFLLFQPDKKKALTLIRELNNYFWLARFQLQTEVQMNMIYYHWIL